jgi:hypothetical protein
MDAGQLRKDRSELWRAGGICRFSKTSTQGSIDNLQAAPEAGLGDPPNIPGTIPRALRFNYAIPNCPANNSGCTLDAKPPPDLETVVVSCFGSYAQTRCDLLGG